jgi:putative transposase
VYQRKNDQEEFLARAYAQDLEGEQISLDEAQAISRKLRSSGKAISSRSILEEILNRQTFKANKKNSQGASAGGTSRDWFC